MSREKKSFNSIYCSTDHKINALLIIKTYSYIVFNFLKN